MQIRSVGIDLGKTTFHLVALSAAGKVLLRKKFTQKLSIHPSLFPCNRAADHTFQGTTGRHLSEIPT